MAGHSLSKMMKHRTKIEKWMADTVRGGGIERHDELHIDRIDGAWRQAATWIPASLEVLELATSIGSSDRYRDLSVVLALSLQSMPQNTGVDFANAGELEKKLGHTPPSLYIFPRGKEPWTQRKGEDVTVRKIDASIFGPTLGPKRCFYMEFKEAGEDEYYRSVFLTG
jgi:hypothetical protein